ncbi:hypothetical protein AAGV37_16335 [Pseudomonas protegens]
MDGANAHPPKDIGGAPGYEDFSGSVSGSESP